MNGISRRPGASVTLRAASAIISRGKGQQFEYAFDDIGNRTSTQAGGDENGIGLLTAQYGANSLNQYTNRDVPSAIDVFGIAFATNTVLVNSQPADRKGEYFWKRIRLHNSTGPVYSEITVASGASNVTGNVFLPKTKEEFSYDPDGNLTQDGRWTYHWDAENRLVAMTNISTVPDPAKMALTFGYDSQGRRVSKTVYTNCAGEYVLSYDQRFVYDGWNLVCSLTSDLRPLTSFTWGLDLSGSLQGAGGVGGLLAVSEISNSQILESHFVAYDGNGNVSLLVSASDGTASAEYAYGPFGEVLRATYANPLVRQSLGGGGFRFSTKYHDDETDLLYYGFRYYNANTGKWLSRDPLGPRGGLNLYEFNRNNPFSFFDMLGKAALHFSYDGVAIWVTPKAWTLLPCLGGPLHFNVHWLVFDSDQGNRYDDRLAATFSDDSVPGPSNSTSSPPSNYQRVPNIEWDNFYDLNLPFCPKGPQNGSVTYEIGAKDPAADPGGLAIIFHWTYSCDCACAEKEPLKVSYEFQPTPPLVNSP